MSSGATSSAAVTGPPYLPTTAGLGGTPTPKVDDPISAVLLLFFIAGAATNMTILQINRRRGHKFIISGMVFGFCMARITALVMRIVWASRQHNVSIAIAANIFTVAGVVLLFLVNLLFTQRIVRAYRPRLGWSRPITYAFRFLFFSVPIVLVMVIPVSVYSFYTLDAHKHDVLRRVQLTGITWMALLAFLPIPITLLTLFAPPRPPHHGTVESFGQGQMRTKVGLLLFTSTILTLGAGFRAGVNFDARPLTDPAWYDSKPCYYIFNYVIEIIVVYTYTISRFDRRFHIPNGSSAPGHYAAGGAVANKEGTVAADGGEAGETAVSGADGAPLGRKTTLADRINNESDVFGSDEEPTLNGNAAEGKTEN
ncbi:hypothetical protein SEUCBS140593_001151 [Sporothrix eucalyptigena]|uniref:Family c-likeg-protein-coupled receptor protein n=1 Tax=Sporothrix eucalyptigena TaxID=1812306 RepID=A0ABP0AVR2_9PEZI